MDKSMDISPDDVVYKSVDKLSSNIEVDPF